MTIPEIIVLILKYSHSATTLKRYSIPGNAAPVDIPADSSVHVALGGILIHLGGSIKDAAGITHTVEAKRSIIPAINHINTAVFDGKTYAQGIYLHNTTEIIAGATSRTITIQYEIKDDKGQSLAIFYADIGV